MARKRLSARFAISTKTATVISVTLGLLSYFIRVYLKRSTHVTGHSISGIETGVLADYLTLALCILAPLLPWLFKLAGYAALKLRPRPGAYSVPYNLLAPLGKSFSEEQAKIEGATVPSHVATAQAAPNTLDVDFGDAAITLLLGQRRLIQKFVGRTRNPDLRPNSLRPALEQEILMITGEPGGGKSVILQELHASLSRGVEAGFHSLVPLIVFASDITLASLDVAAASETPLQNFLLAHYKARGGHLQPLEDIIRQGWDRFDLLVLFDGLDEIPQRSAYEKIQQRLVGLILKDVSSGRQAVHRFVLSCRTDEDLELLRDAPKVTLRGLANDNDRTRFYQALINQASVSSPVRRTIEDALHSRRLAPDHVFRRNPYFLALLVAHLRNNLDWAVQDTLDFDFLMRKYLERESLRPAAALNSSSVDRLPSRRDLFNELESVARLSLQVLAFRCASSANGAGLYDVIEIDTETIRAFLAEVNQDTGNPDEYTCWSGVSNVLADLTSHMEVSLETFQKMVRSGYLQENDLRLLSELARRCRETGANENLIFESFGLLPYWHLSEDDPWYRILARKIYTAARPLTLTPRYALALLLFARGLAAAHALRILTVTHNEILSVRFRHRRLAEYYAACFMRDKWSHLDRPSFTPWLAPVLNLTCAIEGPRCLALRWLVDRVPSVPSEPRYEWRYSVESAVEAAFFAQPGYEYKECIVDLLTLIIATLHSHGLHSMIADRNKCDVVTELALVRAVNALSRLADVTGRLQMPTRSIEQFRSYQARQPAEWITEFAIASRGLETLTGEREPLISRLKTLLKLMQHPSAALGSKTWRQSGTRSSYFGVVISTVTGEILTISLLIALASIIVRYGLHFFFRGTLQQSGLNARLAFLPLALAVPVILMRISAWSHSGYRAADWSSFVWRAIPALRNGILGLPKLRALIALVPRLIAEATWRARLAVCMTVLLGAGLLSLLIWSTSVAWHHSDVPLDHPAHTQSKEGEKGEACTGPNALLQKIASTYKALPSSIPVGSLHLVREKLTHDIAELHSSNRAAKCGLPKDDGWLLAEDYAADILFDRDDRLIPLPPPNTQPVISTYEMHRFDELTKIPSPTDPPRSLAGSVILFRRRSEVARYLAELKDLRARTIQARRDGELSDFDVAMSRGSRGSDKALVSAADLKLKELTAMQVELGRRGSALIMWMLIGGIPAFLAVSVCVRWCWREWNRHKLKTVLMTKSVSNLCSYLTKPSNAEWTRREIIRVLSNRENFSRKDLATVEQTAKRLYDSASLEDRELALETASLVDVISRRLRHRTVVDAPLRDH